MTALYSFGFRHGLTVPGGFRITPGRPYQRVNGALVIDVRRILPKNPYHNRKLRQLRGDHPDVIRELESTPGIGPAYQDIRVTAEVWDGPVYIGCTGGHHRSVYIADRLAKDIGVPVTHLHYHQP